MDYQATESSVEVTSENQEVLTSTVKSENRCVGVFVRWYSVKLDQLSTNLDFLNQDGFASQVWVDLYAWLLVTGNTTQQVDFTHSF